MQRFKPNDAVFILPKFAHLYPGNSALVISANPDLFRPMFNEDTVQFADGSVAPLYEFQLIEDVPTYNTTVADLVFDSQLQPVITPTRGPSAARHIILQTTGFDIDMKISIANSLASIVGQVLERATKTFLPNLEVRLMKEGIPISTTTSDSVGMFKFNNVSRGSLNILVVIPQHFLRILGPLPI